MPRRLHSETGEFTVANEVNHSQEGGSITALKSGGYVVSWYDQSSNAYFVQRYTAAGTLAGPATQVATVLYDVASSDVVGLEGGGFAFAWMERPTDVAPTRVKIQLFNPDGSAGALITDTTVSVQSLIYPPALAALAGGGFVLVHEGNSNGQIALRIFGADGNPAGPELAIASAPNTRGRAPDVLGLPDGRFAVVWEEQTSTSDIKLSLFQANGTLISTTPVATGAQNQLAPQIIQLPTGPLLITWQEQGAQGWDIRAGLFDSATGLLEGSSFLVNSQTLGDQTAPTVAALEDGEFVIAWVGPDAGGRDLSGDAIKVQAFAGDGTRIGGERLLNTHLAGSQSAPELVALENGGIAAVWMTPNLPFPAPYVAVRTTVFDLVDVNVIAGGLGDDDLIGTAGPDDISGLGGDDEIDGGGGDDVLLGGADDDMLLGGAGNDEIDGGDGADVLDGGAGNDILLGGEGDDLLLDSGNLGFDRLDGGEGNDVFEVGGTFSATGSAMLIGGGGNDLFRISWGGTAGYSLESIRVDAGTGDDRIEVGNLRTMASFTLGAGVDTVAFVPYNFGSIGSFGNGGGLTITDFQAGAGGDRLEITAWIDRTIVSGWDGVTNPFTAGFVVLEQSGADTLLRIRSFAEYELLTYIVFKNVSASAFTNDNFDGLRVDGSAAVGVVRNGTSAGDTIVGTMGGDVIDGADGADTIYLNAGNDTGSGGLADDYIEGWTGNDTLDGGEGRDFLDGGYGDDVVSGGAGQDVVRGGYGDDVIDGGADNDSLEGGPGSDTYIIDSNSGTDSIEELDSWLGVDRVRSSITYALGNGLEELELVGTGNLNGTGNGAANLLLGNSGANLLRGLGGADTLDGRGGADTLEGGLGDDIYLIGDSAANVVELANEGNDEVRTTLASYALGANLEKLTGLSATGQQLTGNDLANIIAGAAGTDTLSGGVGNDRLDGGGGADSMTGGTGDDVFIVDNAGDQVIEAAGEGNDEVRTSLAAYTLHANVEKLTGLLTTGQALTGNGEANVIAGGIGNDVIDGGAGADQMAGGGGNDIYVVDSFGDVVTEVAGAGLDEVRTDLIVYSLGANLENLTGTASFGQQLTGNDRANTIVGASGGDRIDGGAGADSMVGGHGDDVYIVDNAGDTVTELASQGNDEIRTALATFSMAAIANVEKLTGTSAAGQTLTGNGSDNLITGGAGNDILNGADGFDKLYGGLGDDIYIVDSFDTPIELANEGIDEVRTSGPNFSLADNGPNIENLTGTSSDWQGLTGNAGANRIVGGSGISYIDGGAGDDVMIGGLGDDTYLVDSLGDVVTELAGEGVDEVRTGLAVYTLAANVENLMATSFANQVLNGNGLDNRIEGGFGNDTLDGAGGADTLYGRWGNDIYIVGAGDVVTEFDDQGSDEVRTALSAYTLGTNVENLTGTSASGQQLTGNELANIITGGAGADLLDGRAGSDSMAGRGGDDVYVVDSSGDAVVELAGEGIDEVRTSLGTYSLAGLANVENLRGTSLSGQSLTGNGLANALFGTAGNDSLNGAAGVDRATGGLGNDTYYVDNTGDVIVELANEGSDTVLASVDYVLTANVENLQSANIGGTDPLRLTGNALNNYIWGTQGNNVIDGAGGADFMIGYAGDDFYQVDNVGDIAYELAGGGADTVATSISYTLAANVENLQAVNIGGTDPLALTGNAQNNHIWATQGNNVIDGGAGADFMIGYGGDDFYFVDNMGDIAYELEGGGLDTVATLASYVLAANVENLQSLNIGGTDALALTGNGLNNYIWATQGNNIIDGGGGADVMIGYGGDDFYYVDNMSDVTVEEAGGGSDTVAATADYKLNANIENLQAAVIGGNAALNLTGNDLSNYIWGTQGNNILAGGGGIDRLFGYAGADQFLFNTAAGAANVDILADFQAGVDKIALDNAVFTALSDGALPASAFVAGTAALDADDRILFNAADGSVWYDADGSGAGATLLVAYVPVGQALTAADFLVV